MRIGIRRKLERNGRLVIPKEYRDFYHLEDDKDVEIIATHEGVLITNPNYKRVKSEEV